MRIVFRVVIVTLMLTGMSRSVYAESRVTLEYEKFTILFDCDKRGAIEFEYSVTKDTGNLPRLSSFKKDEETEEIATGCQQTSNGTYKHDTYSFDRGHLVPANHLDDSPKGIRQSNYMTNILPQARTMNRGAWKLTEEIIECVRDQEDLHVIGGVIYGFNPDDDYFLTSHGVETADYFWKIVKSDTRVIAWLIPNSHSAKRKRLDEYLITVAELERILDKEFEIISAEWKSITISKSWAIPPRCNRG